MTAGAAVIWSFPEAGGFASKLTPTAIGRRLQFLLMWPLYKDAYGMADGFLQNE